MCTKLDVLANKCRTINAPASWIPANAADLTLEPTDLCQCNERNFSASFAATKFCNFAEYPLNSIHQPYNSVTAASVSTLTLEASELSAERNVSATGGGGVTVSHAPYSVFLRVNVNVNLLWISLIKSP